MGKSKLKKILKVCGHGQVQIEEDLEGMQTNHLAGYMLAMVCPSKDCLVNYRQASETSPNRNLCKLFDPDFVLNWKYKQNYSFVKWIALDSGQMKDYKRHHCCSWMNLGERYLWWKQGVVSKRNMDVLLLRRSSNDTQGFSSGSADRFCWELKLLLFELSLLFFLPL